MSNRTGRRGGYAAATVSISLVLLMLGAVGYFLINANIQSRGMISGVGFSIMLDDAITPTQRSAIEQNLKSEPTVREYKYLSKEDAAREFKVFVKTDFEALLNSNPLPASYELTLRGDTDNDQAIPELEKKAASWDGVSLVLYQQKMTETVLKSVRHVNIILLGFGAILLGISIMLIYNTLRLDIASASDTIRTMKLVGAKNSFIRRPFMLRSLSQGALAGVVACVVLYFLTESISLLIPDIELVRDWQLLAVIFCSMILTGIVICTLFTRLALNSFIK